MKVVVDTNILFSFFWENSLTAQLLKSKKFELYTPKLAVNELNKYSLAICKKTGISKNKFNMIMEELIIIIHIIPIIQYSPHIENSLKFSPDKDDAEFLALCLHFSCPLWSNDKLLNSQNIVKVLSTKDVLNLLF